MPGKMKDKRGTSVMPVMYTRKRKTKKDDSPKRDYSNNDGMQGAANKARDAKVDKYASKDDGMKGAASKAKDSKSKGTYSRRKGKITSETAKNTLKDDNKKIGKTSSVTGKKTSKDYEQMKAVADKGEKYKRKSGKVTNKTAKNTLKDNSGTSTKIDKTSKVTDKKSSKDYENYSSAKKPLKSKPDTTANPIEKHLYAARTPESTKGVTGGRIQHYNGSIEDLGKAGVSFGKNVYDGSPSIPNRGTHLKTNQTGSKPDNSERGRQERILKSRGIGRRR